MQTDSVRLVWHSDHVQHSWLARLEGFLVASVGDLGSSSALVDIEQEVSFRVDVVCLLRDYESFEVLRKQARLLALHDGQ